MIDVGDAVTIEATFTDEDGVATNPATLNLDLRAPDGTTTSYAIGALTNDAVGAFSYTFTPNAAGVWRHTWTASGGVTAVETGYVLVGSRAPSSVCQPWTNVAAVRLSCAGVATTGDAPDNVIQDAVDVASELLYVLSGQQFPGICEATVRPCADRGCFNIYADESSWPPSGCACTRLPEVSLGYWPVLGIKEVKIDGVALPAADYYVAHERTLVRRADSSGINDGWPHCQRLDQPDTEEDTWSVEFFYGQAPPAAGQRAATALACELVKGYLGQPCQLPGRATSVSRQGITVTMLNTEALEQGHTGIYEVDLFLETYNPSNLRGATTIWSPDLPGPPWRW